MKQQNSEKQAQNSEKQAQNSEEQSQNREEQPHNSEELQLKLGNFRGFNGEISEGLLRWGQDDFLIYPLNDSVVIRYAKRKGKLASSIQCYGNAICAMALNQCCDLLAIGQQGVQSNGSAADVVVWHLKENKQLFCFREHQHSVHSLSFSKDGKYLASIGGGTPRKLIIWDIETGRMSCHSKLPITVSVVRLYFDTELYAITGGNNDLHTWYFNKQSGNLVSHKCDVGRFQRDVACISVDTLNRNAYVGTTTGDVLVICLEKSYLKTKSKPSQNLQGGVTCIATWETDHILVGSKLGLLHKMKCSSFAIQQSCEVLGGITSIARAHDGSFYVGTDKSNIYNVNSHSFIPVLMASNHCHRINGVVFPKNYSDLFATFSANDIRLWDGRKLEEALRITVSGNECFALDIAPSGEFILSGWSDGSTKAFLPQSGKLYFEVKDSHQNGVTAVACMSDNSMIVTGGMKGDIRLWCLETMGCVLQEIRREHHAKIILLKLGRKDLKMLSASSDGTIITWDMKTFTPVRSFQEKSSLKSVALHPDESLIISAPANQCISFWNSEGGHKIDELLLDDYSQHKTLAISANGNFILTAGSGGLVRLFDLRSGYPIPLADGIGSSGTAQGCAISPDESYAVTVGDGGSMFRWDLIKS